MSGVLAVVPVISAHTADVSVPSMLTPSSALGLSLHDILLVDNTREGWAHKYGIRTHRDPDGHNLGVAGSWNVGAKEVLDRGLDYLLIISSVVQFGPALHTTWLEQMEQFWDANVIEAAGHSWHLIAFHRRVFETVGLFDPNFYPAYCLVPETPVLTANLRWVPIGSVEVGDELIGVDEFADDRRCDLSECNRPLKARGYCEMHYLQAQRGQREFSTEPWQSGSYGSRSYRRAIVTGKSTRLAPCVRITLEDGRQVICSTDHKWLGRNRTSNTLKWRRTDTLEVGYRLYAPLRTWSEETTFEAGWLAGIFDGEGSLHISRTTRGVTFAQNEGAVLDRGKGILAAMDIPFITDRGSNGVTMHVGIYRRAFAMELLGRLRPVRLDASRIWEGSHVRSRDTPALAIESIEPVGVTEVVSIETSTRTFIANGVVSHNCEGIDFGYRMRMVGMEGGPGWVNCWVNALSMGHALHINIVNCPAPPLLDYYAQKWGGEKGHETFAYPFSDKPLDYFEETPIPVLAERYKLGEYGKDWW